MELQTGFYLVNGRSGELLMRTVTKGKGEAKITFEEPIRARTINQAKDLVAIAGSNFGVIYVPTNNFAWGEATGN